MTFRPLRCPPQRQLGECLNRRRPCFTGGADPSSTPRVQNRTVRAEVGNGYVPLNRGNPAAFGLLRRKKHDRRERSTRPPRLATRSTCTSRSSSRTSDAPRHGSASCSARPERCTTDASRHGSPACPTRSARCTTDASRHGSATRATWHGRTRCPSCSARHGSATRAARHGRTRCPSCSARHGRATRAARHGRTRCASRSARHGSATRASRNGSATRASRNGSTRLRRADAAGSP